MTPRTVLVRKQELAIRLERISPYPSPKVRLEQYTIPADLAAEILFIACYAKGDIEGKSVADLGTGTGRLAVGASMLGAGYTVGVDLDHSAIEAAARNCKTLGLRADWVLGDIEALKGPVDTVLMNPPFGTRKRHADIKFLQTAIKIAEVVYSIHKSSTRRFIDRWLQEHNTQVEIVLTTEMKIPHQFPFHRKKMGKANVDVLRIERK